MAIRTAIICFLLNPWQISVGFKVRRAFKSRKKPFLLTENFPDARVAAAFREPQVGMMCARRYSQDTAIHSQPFFLYSYCDISMGQKALLVKVFTRV